MAFWEWADQNYTGSRKFDKKLKKLVGEKNLSWYPWVGAKYKEGGVLVIGESNYVDSSAPAPDPKSAVEMVENDEFFTRRVIDVLGLRDGNDTLDAISKILHPDCVTWNAVVDKRFREKWNDLAYIDISQRAVWAVPKGKKKPFDVKTQVSDEDVAAGWPLMAKVCKVLKPSKILVFSSRSFNCFPHRDQAKENAVGVRYARTYQDDNRIWLFVDHPSYWGGRVYKGAGALSFSYALWRNFVGGFLELPSPQQDVLNQHFKAVERRGKKGLEKDKRRSGAKKNTEGVKKTEGGYAMPTARDVIAAINQNGSVHLDDGLTFLVESQAQTYAQFGSRTVDGVQICYEVRRLSENRLVVQLMAQAEVGRVVDRLRYIAHRARLDCGVAAGMFGVHGGETIDCHGAGVDCLLGRVQTQLQSLYDTFEGELQ